MSMCPMPLGSGLMKRYSSIRVLRESTIRRGNGGDISPGLSACRDWRFSKSAIEPCRTIYQRARFIFLTFYCVYFCR